VTIQKLEQHQHEKPEFHSPTLKAFQSSKEPLTVIEHISSWSTAAEAQNVHDTLNAKAKAIQHALELSSVVSLSSEPAPLLLRPQSILFSSNWAKYPGNKKTSMNLSCFVKLRELYAIGKQEKKRYSAEKALDILLNHIISDK